MSELTTFTSGIENKGGQKRKSELAHNTFKNDKEYGTKSETYNNEDGSKIFAKGSGGGNNTPLQPGNGRIPNGSDAAPVTQQFDTSTGGGLYDVYGVASQGLHTGRVGLQSINKYTPNNYYGIGSPIIGEIRDIKDIAERKTIQSNKG